MLRHQHSNDISLQNSDEYICENVYLLYVRLRKIIFTTIVVIL